MYYFRNIKRWPLILFLIKVHDFDNTYTLLAVNLPPCGLQWNHFSSSSAVSYFWFSHQLLPLWRGGASPATSRTAVSIPMDTSKPHRVHHSSILGFGCFKEFKCPRLRKPEVKMKILTFSRVFVLDKTTNRFCNF